MACDHNILCLLLNLTRTKSGSIVGGLWCSTDVDAIAVAGCDWFHADPDSDGIIVRVVLMPHMGSARGGRYGVIPRACFEWVR